MAEFCTPPCPPPSFKPLVAPYRQLSFNRNSYATHAVSCRARLYSFSSAACSCRDVKPENLLLQKKNRGHHETSSAHGGHQPIGPDETRKPFAVGDLHLRLIDFGSALDKHSIEHLYGGNGPSDDEQTAEYAPPEVLLAR